ncbi:MAG: methionyl-tRNA formyltransferase [Pyrinomonadaceae bacterium]|nr:methionyl-tRNA formyltransferase [Pyrinomonadaceae bacterium]MBP6211993.1 methionyl-tRNA formyltransferase [Pyrinomonadaceae bacterium]
MKIVFMGTPQAAVPSLERCISDGHQIVAVYTQPDRPSGRGNKITFSPVKECAITNGLPVIQPVKVRTPEALAEFRSHDADVAVVVAYGRILPETFLNAFPLGAINVHFSLLPKYRGAAPVNWAIANGETETGVTTMQMDAGLDTGAILLQTAIEIGSDETAIELMTALSQVGADLLSETLRSAGSIEPREQDHSQATLAPIMNKDDGRIDWTRNSREVFDRIRAFQPFPTSFTFLGDAKLTIWKAELGPQTREAPGTITAARGDELIVACGGKSSISVREIQAEGKRRVAVRDFLNGAKLKVGEVLT